MPILVNCKCGKQFQTKDENAGRRARCPECGTGLIIPNPGGGGVADVIENPYLAPPTPQDAAPFVEPRTSGKAIASLVLGISSLLCLIVTGLPAIILGAMGLSDISGSRGSITGKGMATTGIVLGGITSTMLPVIAVLIALLLPAVQAAREAARRSTCINNLKQVALAMHSYHDQHGVLPPVSTFDPEGRPLLSWRVVILPYLGHEKLYHQFKLDAPWDSPANKPLMAQMPPVFACPSWPNGGPESTTYQVLIGPGTLFEKAVGIAFREVTDGTSNTLMVLETKTLTPWTQPTALTYTPKQPIEGLGSYHTGGFNAAFADGSVRFIKDSTAPGTLEALATRNGGDVNSGSF